MLCVCAYVCACVCVCGLDWVLLMMGRVTPSVRVYGMEEINEFSCLIFNNNSLPAREQTPVAYAAVATVVAVSADVLLFGNYPFYAYMHIYIFTYMSTCTQSRVLI